jgi:hypothetical protein
VKIKGYCPMGCGETLWAALDAGVVCLNRHCPDPRVVAKVLADPEVGHVARIDASGWTLMHPLHERLGEQPEMFTCGISKWLRAHAEMPADRGTYRVLPDGDGYRLEPLS